MFVSHSIGIHTEPQLHLHCYPVKAAATLILKLLTSTI